VVGAYFAAQASVKQVGQAGNQVGREPWCRPPRGDDFDKVYKIIKAGKLGPADHSQTYEEILEAWREVLCGGGGGGR
jgi:hypothetical protein